MSMGARILAAIALVVVLTLTAITVVLTGGFSYAMDDAYIHLRLSEVVARGSYGINPGDPASPSSSILWPFLLAPFAAWNVHQFVPLVIAGAALCATVVGAYWALSLTWGSARTGVRIVLVLILGLALNWFGMPLTGMEHSAQILMSIGCAAGLISAATTGVIPWWFWGAALLGPLLRYENLGVTLASLIAVAALGRWRPAAGVFIGVFALLGGFTLFLVSIGLPWLPSSVLIKSGTRQMVPLSDLDLTGKTSLPLAILVIVGLAFAVSAAVRSRQRPALRPWAVVLVAAVLALLAHLMAGPTIMQLGRYQAYVLSFAGLLILSALPALWPRLAVGAYPVIATMALLLFLIMFTRLWTISTVLTPLAARSIYDQQFHLHRFATEYLKAPIAVNDLGWVSYRNPQRVVDIFGLGSPEAASARASGEPNWIEGIAPPREVPAAAVFTSWFGDDIPDSWVLVGSLTTPAEGMPSEHTVDIYATSATSVPQVRLALDRLASDAGPRTYITTSP